MSSTTFAPASIALELAPCPALMDLLASEFERVYALHGPYFDDSHTARHIHSLNAMESLRQACLDYVATIHSRLRFRLSGNVRINQLPQDVLIHVFSVMSLDDVVRATHVCHAWRKLGLETATLWTNVVLVGPAVASATEILDRSKAAPVDIHLSQLSPAQWRVSITSLNCHMYKVRSLTIRPRMYEPTRNGRPPRTYLTDAWILPAVPGLRVLDIIWDHLYSPLVLSTSQGLSSADFASLQHVTLKRLRDLDFLSLCSQLRSLVVDIPDDFPLSRLLGIIAGNVTLRHLELFFPAEHNPDNAGARHPWADVSDDWRTMTIRNRLETFRLESATSISDPGWGMWQPNPLPAATIPYEELLIHVLDSSLIRYLALGARPRMVDLCSTLFHQLHLIRHLDIGRTKWRVQDVRGFRRDVLFQSVAELSSLLPLLPTVCTLRLPMAMWAEFNGHVAELICLEELCLVGSLFECSMIHRSVRCPNLRLLSIVFERPFEWGWAGVWHSLAYDADSDSAVGIAFSLAASRISSCPRPLQQLRVAGHFITHDETFDTLRSTSFVNVVKLCTELDIGPFNESEEDST